MKVLLMYEPRTEHFDRLRRAAPAATFAVARTEEEARLEICDADAVLGNRFFYQSAAAGTRLKWMQSNSVGVDLILRNVDTRFSVTATREIYEDEIAEHAVALALALVRNLHRFRDLQKLAKWERTALGTLRGSHALILGRGGVGGRIAQMAGALGAVVTAVGRDEISWREQLSGFRFVFLALPLTAATHRLFGADEIAALQPGAFIINVGRGETVDQEALLQALRTGAIAGAAFDVFAEEPLSPNHPLFAETNVIITPHVARSVDPEQRWESVFEENLRRFAANEQLLYLVDLEKGY